MSKLFKFQLALCGLGFCAGLAVSVARAETLDFDHVLQAAISHSYDLKIAQTDIGISKTDVMAARSQYFPVIQARGSVERLRNLQTQPGSVATINNMVLPYGTRFQNTVGLSLNHTITDFGVRKRKLDIAKQEVKVKSQAYEQQLRNIKYSVVDAYCKALINYKSLKAAEAVLTLTQNVYQMKKRLYQSQAIPKVDMAEEAIQLAQALDDIEVYRQKLSESLDGLSLLTRDSYEPADIELLNFQDSELGNLPVFNENLTPEAKMYDLQIQQKQEEVELLKRQYLPQISMYSYYNLYGYDLDHLNKAIGNLGQRSVNLGLSVSLPVFDGFKNLAAIKKAELEKQKLALQKEDKLADMKNQVAVLTSQAQGYSVQLKTKAVILNKTQDKMSMLQRLSDQQVIEQAESVKEHIQRIQRQLQVESSIIQGVAAMKKLQFISIGQS